MLCIFGNEGFRSPKGVQSRFPFKVLAALRASTSIGFRNIASMPWRHARSRPFILNLIVAGIPILHRDKADGRAAFAKNHCTFVSKKI
jgi:hypothetical protein